MVDMSYYPVRLEGSAWVTYPITLALLKRVSIQPTEQQIAEFAQSPAFLDMMFKDREVHQVRVCAAQVEARWGC